MMHEIRAKNNFRAGQFYGWTGSFPVAILNNFEEWPNKFSIIGFLKPGSEFLIIKDSFYCRTFSGHKEEWIKVILLGENVIGWLRTSYFGAYLLEIIDYCLGPKSK